MKKSRQNLLIILGALFIAQCIIIILINLFSAQNIKSRNIQQYLLKKYRSENVASIKIEDPNSSFTVKRKGESDWQILYDKHTLPADYEQITAYLKLLGDITKGIVVSSGKEDTALESYGFGSSSKLVLTVTMKNGKKHTIHVGNPGSTRGSSFIRYNNDKKVREVKSYISTQTSNQYIVWSKKKIFNTQIQGKDVKSVRLVPGNDPGLLSAAYTIQQLPSSLEEEDKSKTVFQTIPAPEAGELNYVELNSMVYNIIRLTIDEYKLEGDVAGKDKAAEIIVTLSSGKELEIDFYTADENDPGDYVVKVSGESHLYLVSRETAAGIIMDMDKLVVNLDQPVVDQSGN